MQIVDGREKFTGISDAIRRKYYPVTNLEVEIMVEWISKSTDEYGLKIWFSLWQEAIDLIQLVKPAVLPKVINQEVILQRNSTRLTTKMVKAMDSRQL
jgi:hypothetical protein